MDSGEDDLRNVALSTALKSSYADLRSVALPAMVRSSQSFVVNITGSDGSTDSTNLLEKLGQNFDVQVDNYNKVTNSFIASTSASGAVATVGGPPFPHDRPSHVSGERLSFSFDIARVVPGSGCTGVAVLSGDSGKLKGTMHCAGNYTANYKIAIDVLK